MCDGAPDGKENAQFNYLISSCKIFMFEVVQFWHENYFYEKLHTVWHFGL